MKGRAILILFSLAQIILLIFLLFTLPEPAGHLKAAKRTIQDLTRSGVLKPADSLEHDVTAALSGYRLFAGICVGNILATAFTLCAFLRVNRSAPLSKEGQ